MTYINHSYVCFRCGGILGNNTTKYPPEKVGFKNYHWHCGDKVATEMKLEKERLEKLRNNK